MIVVFDMLCAFMKNRVTGDMDSNLTIGMERNLKGNHSREVLKESYQSGELGSHTLHGMVLYFGRREGN